MEKATERRVDVFNERPEDFFPYARIEVVDKPDPTGIGMTEKIFTGPLNRQLRDALSYIKNYIFISNFSCRKLPLQRKNSVAACRS